MLIALFSLKNSRSLENLTPKPDKLLPNELGLLSLGSTTTAKKSSQGRRVSHDSSACEPTVLLSTKQRDGSCHEDRRAITFSDGFEAGSFKLWGTRDLHFYQLKQIKRVELFVEPTGTTSSFVLTLKGSRRENPQVKPLVLMLD